jgi:hypothetical protein
MVGLHSDTIPKIGVARLRGGLHEMVRLEASWTASATEPGRIVALGCERL